MQGDPSYTVVPPEERLTVLRVFADADIVIKVLMAGLAIAALIAIAVWVVQVIRLGRRQSAGFEGGMTYLAALSSAAPLIGFFGAAYTCFASFLGMANTRPAPSLSILAPGYAEALLIVMLGLLAAAIAVIGRHHLKAKLFAVGEAAGEAAPKEIAMTQARMATF